MFKPKKCTECGDTIMQDGRCWTCRPETEADVAAIEPKKVYSPEEQRLLDMAAAINAKKGRVALAAPATPALRPIVQTPPVKAPIAAAPVTHRAGTFDRNAYHRAYMRDYMRHRRAKAKDTAP